MDQNGESKQCYDNYEPRGMFRREVFEIALNFLESENLTEQEVIGCLKNCTEFFEVGGADNDTTRDFSMVKVRRAGGGDSGPMTQYFAYGSNMDPEQISRRLQRVPAAQAAWREGYRLCFNKVAKGKPGVGWANVVAGKDSDVVHGVLYDISEADLKILDRVEGGYSQQPIEVHLSDGTPIPAVTYIACQDRTQDGLLPTREYLNHLLAGRKHLPSDYVLALETQPVREC